jgi:hypothetical protein
MQAAVTFQTQRIVPRVVGVGGRRRLALPAPEAGAPPLTIEEIERLPGRFDALADRAAAVRERLGQLTFYLFDPDSWR